MKTCHMHFIRLSLGTRKLKMTWFFIYIYHAEYRIIHYRWSSAAISWFDLDPCKIKLINAINAALYKE